MHDCRCVSHLKFKAGSGYNISNTNLTKGLVSLMGVILRFLISMLKALACCWFLPCLAQASIHFIRVTPISLQEKNGGIIFIFQEDGKSNVSTLEVKRRGKCNSAAREVIYRVSEAEYQAALSLLKAQVNAGQPFAFGLEALSVPKKKHHFWAINLKRFAPNNPEHTRVWSINADVGSDICPYKKL